MNLLECDIVPLGKELPKIWRMAVCLQGQAVIFWTAGPWRCRHYHPL